MASNVFEAANDTMKKGHEELIGTVYDALPQALLDVYTIQRELKRLDNLRVGLVGDLANGRTVRSLAYLLSMYSGIKFYFVAPDVVRMQVRLLSACLLKGRSTYCDVGIKSVSHCCSSTAGVFQGLILDVDAFGQWSTQTGGRDIPCALLHWHGISVYS